MYNQVIFKGLVLASILNFCEMSITFAEEAPQIIQAAMFNPNISLNMSCLSSSHSLSQVEPETTQATGKRKMKDAYPLSTGQDNGIFLEKERLLKKQAKGNEHTARSQPAATSTIKNESILSIDFTPNIQLGDNFIEILPEDVLDQSILPIFKLGKDDRTFASLAVTCRKLRNLVYHIYHKANQANHFLPWGDCPDFSDRMIYYTNLYMKSLIGIHINIKFNFAVQADRLEFGKLCYLLTDTSLIPPESLVNRYSRLLYQACILATNQFAADIENMKMMFLDVRGFLNVFKFSKTKKNAYQNAIALYLHFTHFLQNNGIPDENTIKSLNNDPLYTKLITSLIAPLNVDLLMQKKDLKSYASFTLLPMYETALINVINRDPVPSLCLLQNAIELYRKDPKKNLETLNYIKKLLDLRVVYNLEWDIPIAAEYLDVANCYFQAQSFTEAAELFKIYLDKANEEKITVAPSVLQDLNQALTHLKTSKTGATKPSVG
jgi:hypothetical protein